MTRIEAFIKFLQDFIDALEKGLNKSWKSS